VTIALIIPDRKLEDLQQRLRAALPGVVIEIWPQLTDPAAVTFAVLWKQPAGVLAQFPNLKALQSYGAGIDSIMTDPDLPALPLARVVDPALTESMLRYLAGIESYYRLRLDQFNRQQQQALWKPKSPRILKTLCVLGLGELGAAAARHFQVQGYQVTGWSRTAKDIPGIRCFAGPEGLAPALQDADLVICLLPLTLATTQLLNQQVLAMMKPGVILINVARGAIVEDQALLAALDSGQVQAACLDVFSQEPLPATDPYWQHPAVMVTPHISAVTRIDSVVAQIAENYRRAEQGRPLLNQVDLQQGY
jgi:glyoxylate/hydroxypyruvate reductase A